jgi:hypothetical protein
MNLIAQFFLGAVRKWFKSIPTSIIPNFEIFETLFLGRWEVRKTL